MGSYTRDQAPEVVLMPGIRKESLATLRAQTGGSFRHSGMRDEGSFWPLFLLRQIGYISSGGLGTAFLRDTASERERGD